MICRSSTKFKDIENPETKEKYSIYEALTEDNKEVWLLCAHNNRENVLYSCDMESNPTPEDMISWFFGEFDNIE